MRRPGLCRDRLHPGHIIQTHLRHWSRHSNLQLPIDCLLFPFFDPRDFVLYKLTTKLPYPSTKPNLVEFTSRLKPSMPTCSICIDTLKMPVSLPCGMSLVIVQSSADTHCRTHILQRMSHSSYKRRQAILRGALLPNVPEPIFNRYAGLVTR